MYCVCACGSYSAGVGDRGQMAGVRFLLPPGGSGDETQVCKCLYPLSPLPALPSHQNVFLKVGSFFVDLEVEAAYISWESAPGISPTLASFILLAQRLAAASPRSPQHGVSTEQYISVLLE